MTTDGVTYGRLTSLLTGLGFRPRPLDEHRIAYYHKPSESLFILHDRRPDTPARESDLNHVRFQLHWRGLMDEADFDAQFHPTTATSS
jgi:hypothetical protein